MRYDELLTLLIAENENRRFELSGIKPSMDPVRFLMDFCTVSVDIGRGVGKTSYILNTATKNDIVIVHNHLASHEFHKRGLNVAVADRMNDPWQKKLPYRRIWVDEPSICNSIGVSKYLIYATFLSKDTDQTFIFLGT